mmetsp:Transcript_94054/g.155470  ORF Transcript_94054/g.155470 Transcript_94054/m.155470 type:complete len:214 (+) Transcript_94054:3-644(+)
MSQPTRYFDWPSTGQIAIEQGDVAWGSTGAGVWQSEVLLARYLVANPDLVNGKRVLEMGCGTGLSGVVASRLGASSVLLTDYVDSVLKRADRNAKANAKGALIEARKLSWSEAVPQELRGNIDVILASDCLYNANGWRIFATTVVDLLKPKSGLLLVSEAGHAKIPSETTMSGFTTATTMSGLRCDEPFSADDGETNALLMTASVPGSRRAGA